MKKLKKANYQINYKKHQHFILSLLHVTPKNLLLGETFMEKKKKKRKKEKEKDAKEEEGRNCKKQDKEDDE